MRDQAELERRERDFHAATHAGDWHRAERLALAALREGEAERRRKGCLARAFAPRPAEGLPAVARTTGRRDADRTRPGRST